MVLRFVLQRALRRAVVLILPAIFLVPGCGEIEWNWDTTWWRRPKRTVRPTRPVAQRPPGDSERTDGGGAIVRRDDSAEDGDLRADRGNEENLRPRDAELGGRPFFNLYLRSSDYEEGERPRGEAGIILSRAAPRACAQLLEMLYVPMGRSGSPTESYLIYENRDEFEAARAYAPRLDVAPMTAPAAPVGSEAAFRAGLSLFMSIVESESIVDPRLVETCERNLSEAAQSADLSVTDRWAAGILAGRLACDYRYDYVASRSYYRQAERSAPADSIEAMTAQWRRAESLAREGKTGEAAVAYSRIVSRFGDRWPAAGIVRQARAKQGSDPEK